MDILILDAETIKMTLRTEVIIITMLDVEATSSMTSMSIGHKVMIIARLLQLEMTVVMMEASEVTLAEGQMVLIPREEGQMPYNLGRPQLQISVRISNIRLRIRTHQLLVGVLLTKVMTMHKHVLSIHMIRSNSVD